MSPVMAKKAGPSKKDFAPLDFNHCKNGTDANEMLKKLIWGGAGGIMMLPLFELEKGLFGKIVKEVQSVLKQPAQVVDGSHPTVKFIEKQDKAWKPKAGGVQQYSLYNSKNDFLYNEDDHHWSNAKRKFNSMLTYIPQFVEKYFKDTELQNFRLNALTKDGGLGQHREKIIGIPGRETSYKLRFHLPVITNPKVVFFMDGQEHFMSAGTATLFNQSCLHGVNNAGEALRAHLVWDCYLNNHIVRKLMEPALKGGKTLLVQREHGGDHGRM